MTIFILRVIFSIKTNKFELLRLAYMHSILPVILCGGSGARLWPLSRSKFPKQYLELIGDYSLLQSTIKRLIGIDGVKNPILVCNEEHRFIVSEQLRLLGQQGQIILEPVSRNTAPALTLAALYAHKTGDDPILVVMPADHFIENDQTFRNALNDAVSLASKGLVVTLGIPPTSPETGYGYIKRGIPLSTGFILEQFVEKPKIEIAQFYFDSGEYLWNSGIFIMRASIWIEAILKCRPEIFDACDKAINSSSEDGDFIRIRSDLFADCHSDSIDYAVMEHLPVDLPGLPASAVIPMSAGWSDLGTWDALWKVLPKSKTGNASRGDVVISKCKNTLAISESRLVTCIGVSDLIVVETSDAVLVINQAFSQNVKTLVAELKSNQRNEVSWHRKEHRPWGWFDSIDSSERFLVKRISVIPGGTLSLQMHHHRSEHWIVVSGTAQVTKGDEVFILAEGQSTYIPLGITHRLKNPGLIPLELIEVQSGSHLAENDIVRFSDSYGRI
jgi:mannose-1-phosphate guanylyltransferase/mannose-6-phosphate isomerase